MASATAAITSLTNDLHSLIIETRRKNPEVREAADKALAILRPFEPSRTDLRSHAQASDIIRPIFLGCAVKNAKAVGIALGALQRLVSNKSVPAIMIPRVIDTLSDCMSHGVEMQLKIHQTVLSVFTNYDIHGKIVADALLLCFQLHRARVGVVASTAAATLRQLVILIFDKLALERHTESMSESVDVALPDGSLTVLEIAFADAFLILQDFCLLANSEKTRFLRVDHLSKTFALELIESILANHHQMLCQRSELFQVLRYHLCPTLLKLLSDKSLFPLILRTIRVVFLLLKHFPLTLTAESEVFLSLLLKMAIPDNEDKQFNKALWFRVLIMEVLRGLCSDVEYLIGVWERCDTQSNIPLFGRLVGVLKRLAMEKPVLIGTSEEMYGIGITNATIASPTKMIASAASGVVTIMNSENVLDKSSVMKLQCIDQLDKADPPVIPEKYMIYLTAQTLRSLAESITGFIYTHTVTRSPSLSMSHLTQKYTPSSRIIPADETKIPSIRAMLEHAWPGLLASYSVFISGNLSEDIFAEILSGYQLLLLACGLLRLATPRDALFVHLSKLAVPSEILLALDTGSAADALPPKSANVLQDSIGVVVSGSTATNTQSPSLSRRNLACLRVLIGSLLILADYVSDGWYKALELLQSADYVINLKGPTKQTSDVSKLISDETTVPVSSQFVMKDLTYENMSSSMEKVFVRINELSPMDFRLFLLALCRLSADTIASQRTTSSDGQRPSDVEPSKPSRLSPFGNEHAHRRRLSGLQIMKTLKSGDYGINKLQHLAATNLAPFLLEDRTLAWEPAARHLQGVLSDPHVPAVLRAQAAECLDATLHLMSKASTKMGGQAPDIQMRILDAIHSQTVLTTRSAFSATDLEVQRMGLETLLKILRICGHTLRSGWSIVFDTLSSVCQPNKAAPSTSRMEMSSTASLKSAENNLRVAFQSVTFVCDSLDYLSSEDLRRIIKTVGLFGRQSDTNIALTAAESLLWNISDSIQAKRREASESAAYTGLWMLLLQELLILAIDIRREVRNGAIQTLFRTLQLYGMTLPLNTWEAALQEIIHPLIADIARFLLSPRNESEQHENEQMQDWEGSRILSMQSYGELLSAYLGDRIIHTASYENTWNVFLEQVYSAATVESAESGLAALQALSKSLLALDQASLAVPSAGSFSYARVLAVVNRVSVVVHSAHASNSGNAGTGENSSNIFSQAELCCLVDLFRLCHSASSRLGTPWSITQTVDALQHVYTFVSYGTSTDLRPDHDKLSPLQSTALDFVYQLDVRGSEQILSAVLSYLSKYSSLAFLQDKFNHSDLPPNGLSNEHSSGLNTYLALSEVCTPKLVDLYVRFSSKARVQENGTLNDIISVESQVIVRLPSLISDIQALALPIRMRYGRYPSVHQSQKEPLWVSAARSFLNLATEYCKRTPLPGVSQDNLSRHWRQLSDVYAILLAEETSTSDPKFEEQVDSALFDHLEKSMIGHLGHHSVPDSAILHFCSALQQSSFRVDHRTSPRAHCVVPAGTTHVQSGRRRTNVQFRSFNLLVTLCRRESESSNIKERTRVASFALTSLLTVSRDTMASYVADAKIRGSVPLPRYRTIEVCHILLKLSRLELWEGLSSTAPGTQKHETRLGGGSRSENTTLIRELARQSSHAHLFDLHHIFCDIAALLPTHFTGLGFADPLDTQRVSEEVLEQSTASPSMLALLCLYTAGSAMGFS